MFSGTGFRVDGGTFYNVNGDVHLEAHHHRHEHREIHNVHASAPLRLDSGAGGSQQPLVMGGGGVQLDFGGGGAEPPSGLTRNPHHRATRQVPYDGSLRPRSAGFPSNEAPPMVASARPHSTSAPYPPPPPLSDNFHFPTHHQRLYPRNTDDLQLSAPESTPSHLEYDGSRSAPLYTSEGREYSTPYPNGPNVAPNFQGGAYISAQNVYDNRQGETGMHILQRSVALEALYDSADSFPPPRCYPETRTEILAKLYNWLTEDVSARSISWLYGPAGAGKSVIMQTLCRRLQDAGRLGGAFFFQRDHVTRGNAKALFTTLSYQLAENNDRLKPTISQTVEQYSSIVGREMEVQLHHLIVEPCRALPNSPPSIFLVDGLDECQHDSVQSEILRLIGNTVRKYPTRFRFLVASRPEAAISETVDDPLFTELLTRLNIEQSFNDVRTYLHGEFARIHREHRHTMGAIPTPWPSLEILDSLVQKSSGYFVYASTVIKFVGDKSFRPTERLNDVLALPSDTPFKSLDQLYIHILSNVPQQFHSGLLDILQCVAMGFRLNCCTIDDLFEWPPGEGQLILRGLHSLLHVAAPTEGRGCISAHHASFLDFLRDEKRSSTFHLDLQRRMNLTRATLKAFSGENGLPPTLWRLHVHDLFRCIHSVPPSLELVPLIQNLNPYSLWRHRLVHNFNRVARIAKVATWLKDICPAPEDVIQRWENYHFISLWELVFRQLINLEHLPLFSLSGPMCRVLQAKMSQFLPHQLATYRQLVVQSPKVIRIFQARWLLGGYQYLSDVSLFVHLPLSLDESWDNITGAVAAFRSITGNLEGRKNPLQVIAATTITLLALSQEIFPDSAQNLLGELACGWLCPRNLCSVWLKPNKHLIAWGQLVRWSPYPNSLLLDRLNKFTPPWDDFNSSTLSLRLTPVEFHDVLQWLKAHPDLPMVLITRWEGYLAESLHRCSQAGQWFDTDLESRSRSSKFKRPGADPSQSELTQFDAEGVIHCYESAVESMFEVQ
ncbi:hypothetical protein B0H16DRAFT_65799 [Mycena metata]|uniref:NACHT domain-containing protein n=1 Tax=Mycena metata TaxID=1033252 RepID=A0AAD7ICF9_9AGAR|nr:hypothetical protein B0H16DRAFT_65799 [Mycena metata]